MFLNKNNLHSRKWFYSVGLDCTGYTGVQQISGKIIINWKREKKNCSNSEWPIEYFIQRIFNIIYDICRDETIFIIDRNMSVPVIGEAVAPLFFFSSFFLRNATPIGRSNKWENCTSADETIYYMLLFIFSSKVVT